MLSNPFFIWIVRLLPLLLLFLPALNSSPSLDPGDTKPLMMQSGVWDPNFAGFQWVLLVLPPVRPSVLLGMGDACGLAARLGQVVSMAVASKSKPGPGARTEHL